VPAIERPHCADAYQRRSNALSIIGFLILGLIVGALAKMILPGRQGGGWLATLILGVVGAFVGGLLGSVIFDVNLGSFWDLKTWLLALIGAVIVLAIWGFIRSRGSSTRAA
jgi:uncharacterized membrane protein YeaQ/YmgE (transglycosylase-associated protein family)